MTDHDQGDHDEHGGKGDKKGNENFLQEQHEAKDHLPGICHDHAGVNVCLFADIAL